MVVAVWNDAIWGDTTQEDTKKYVAGAKDFDAALDNLYETVMMRQLLCIRNTLPLLLWQQAQQDHIILIRRIF